MKVRADPARISKFDLVEAVILRALAAWTSPLGLDPKNYGFEATWPAIAPVEGGALIPS
jgi:hypothetical protein